MHNSNNSDRDDEKEIKVEYLAANHEETQPTRQPDKEATADIEIVHSSDSVRSRLDCNVSSVTTRILYK